MDLPELGFAFTCDVPAARCKLDHCVTSIAPPPALALGLLERRFQAKVLRTLLVIGVCDGTTRGADRDFAMRTSERVKGHGSLPSIDPLRTRRRRAIPPISGRYGVLFCFLLQKTPDVGGDVRYNDLSGYFQHATFRRI